MASTNSIRMYLWFLTFSLNSSQKILPFRWIHLVEHCCSPSKICITRGTEHCYILVNLNIYSFIECLLCAKYCTNRKMALLSGMCMTYPEIPCSFCPCRNSIHIQSLCAETYFGVVTEQALFKSNSWIILTTCSAKSLLPRSPQFIYK